MKHFKSSFVDMGHIMHSLDNFTRKIGSMPTEDVLFSDLSWFPAEVSRILHQRSLRKSLL